MSKLIYRLTIVAAALALLMLAVSGPGTRLDLWEFRFGFSLMRWATWVGLASALVALVMLIWPRLRQGRILGLTAALLMAVIAAAVPLHGLFTVRSLPMIHDISTDLDQPPQFVAVLPLRADAPNPPEHPGEEVADQQRQAYPDISTLTLNRPAVATFAIALAAAEQMGWEIVAAEPTEGRIEAVATTFWYGFRDDVVVRVGSDNGASRIDVRSKSRVGLSDVGANARRIRQYLDRVRQAAG